MIQSSGLPDLWRDQLEHAGKALENGIEVYAQIAARPFGMLFGFPGHHAFTHRPTFRKLKAELDRDELARRLADPAVREAILSEADLPPDPAVLFDAMYALIQHSADRMYPLGYPLDYEPTPDQTVAAIAQAARRGSVGHDVRPDARMRGGRDVDAAVLQLRRGKPRRHLRDVDASRGRVGAVRRRRPLRADLRCFVSVVPADPLGARPPPRPEAVARVRGTQADPRYRNAFRALRSRCHRGWQEGRPQRHRHGCADPRTAARWSTTCPPAAAG